MSARTVLMVAGLLAARGAAAGAPADYAVTFALATPDAAASAWAIELTPDVHAWLQDAALRDLEVFNAAGQPVPFARLATPAERPRTQAVALPLLALPPVKAAGANDLRLVIERDAAGRLRRLDAGEQAAPASGGTRDWLLDASALAQPIERLELGWNAPATGVVARCRVEAGDDLQHWREVGSGSVLALEQDGARLDKRDLALDAARAPYLRLQRLDDGPELSGLHVQAHTVERGPAAPARAWLEASHAATGPDAAAGSFDYILPAALAVEAARIELASDNALAPLTLAARANGASAWRELARITAFRLRLGDERVFNDEVAFGPGVPVRMLRLTPAVPLAAAPRLQLAWQPERFVFLAEGDGPYRLAAGSARARRADYPIEAALAGLRAKLGRDWQPPLARLGAAQESAGHAALTPPSAPIPWRRWLLWAVLVAGAAAVGGFALSLLRERR
jgi:hypothetical protein